MIKPKFIFSKVLKLIKNKDFRKIRRYLGNWYCIEVSGTFDKKLYKNYYQAKNSGVPLVLHYVVWGSKLDLSPNREFDPAYYLMRNPDVKRSGIDPFVHYLKYGRHEGREGGIKPLVVKNDSTVVEQKVMPINVSQSEQPVVSIIIPVYNQFEYTCHCVYALEKVLTIPYEIIIADDCSEDNTVNLEEVFKGIKIIRNETNLGFLKNNNNAASHATGKYLLFLNNDTEVKYGAIEAMLDILETQSDVGIVGAKLIFPDGRLQEAGGIVWQDGGAWNYGRFESPDAPEYNYVKDVDYVSGACLMIRRSLWLELGAFDETYAPAYYEDTDLAFEARKAGYRVVLSPKSEVIHHEGISCGTDIGSGIKAYQEINKEKFINKWRNELEKQVPPDYDRLLFCARDRSFDKKIIVFIDHHVPFYDKDCGSKSTLQYIKFFVDMGLNVKFIGDNYFRHEPYSSTLELLGVEVLYGEHYAENWQQWLLQNNHCIDYVFIHRPHIGIKYIEFCQQNLKAEIWYQCHDYHKMRIQRQHDLDNTALNQDEIEIIKQEDTCIRKTDICFSFSSYEIEILAKEYPKVKFVNIPLYVFENFPPNAISYMERQDLLFVGGFNHEPNVDAVVWFVEHVFSKVSKAVPGIKLHIVGSNPPQEVCDLNNEDIIIHGYVSNDELENFYERTRINVAPLRYGAGVKGKVVESLFYGLPLVGTSIAWEGIDDDGLFANAVDDAAKMATEIVNLYGDENKWKRLSKAYLAYVAEKFSYASLIQIFEKLENHNTKLSQGKLLSPESNRICIPVASDIDTNESFRKVFASDEFKSIDGYVKDLLSKTNSPEFCVDGFCAVCKKKVDFIVDQYAAEYYDGLPCEPNWRERLECPFCHMNNRQRLIFALVRKAINQKTFRNTKPTVYFMEQVTPIYRNIRLAFPDCQIIGSEYIRPDLKSGSMENGIRHEDIQALSFADNSIDFIISNDVFEHVPDPLEGFSECARVLKKDGMLIATFPFHDNKNKSVTRAKIINGEIDNLLGAQYHGNPVAEEGSLVFTDFGWDILSMMKQSGFKSAAFDFFASKELAHLGNGGLVFKGTV